MNKAISYISIVLLISFIMSCNKEEFNTNAFHLKDISTDVIPFYSNINDVFARIDTINDIDSIANRVVYEENTGYKSIGLFSDLFMDTLEITSLFDDEDSVMLFYNNNKFVVDTIWDNGELYIEPKYNDNIFRSVADENGLFRIGDTVVRIFKRKNIATHINNISGLLSIKEDNCILPNNNFFYFYSSHHIDPIIQYHNCNSNLGLSCTTAHTPNHSLGDRRVKIKTEWVFDIAYNGNPTCNNYRYHIIFKGYKKTRVGFVSIKSNISYRWDIIFHWLTPYYQWTEEHRERGITTEYKHKIDKTVFQNNCCDILGFPGVHLAHLYIQTYAPSSGVLTINQ